MTAKATVTTEAPVGKVPPTPDRTNGWSAVVFAVAAVVALPLLLWFGRHYWFFLDEWWGLNRSEAWHPSYLDGHNGHWLTLTRLQYRATFQLFGLRTYLPYQIPTVVAHVLTAVLLRLAARRCGVRGWIATTVGIAFLLFGAGWENIMWGWQSNTTGSLVFGFALFLLADGSLEVTRRDWLGLALGIVGLMTSAAFVGIVAGLAVTLLLRRGLRVAAFYTLPLATIYGAWYAAYGTESTDVPFRLTGRTLWFVARMSWAVFDALAQGPVGLVLLALAAAGLATALHRAVQTRDRAEAALPAGLTVAWLAFAGLTALGRAEVPITAASYASSRYVHVGAALFLPVAALGAERLAARRAVLGALALIPLAIGVPGNIDLLADPNPGFTGGRNVVLAMARSPYLDDVPPGTMPMRFDVGYGVIIEVPLTTGWLSRQADAGRVPEPSKPTPRLDLTVAGQIVLSQTRGGNAGAGCPRMTAGVPLTLDRGDQLRFDGAVNVVVKDGADTSLPLPYNSRNGSVVRALAGPLDLVVVPAPGARPRLCPPPPG